MPFIIARLTSRCPVCLSLIFPGQVIGSVPRVGWIHGACTEHLDTALPELTSRQLYGTYRIRAEVWSKRPACQRCARFKRG